MMYTIFRRNIDCQCLTLLYLVLLQLGKQLFSFSTVTLEPLSYQLVLLCKKPSCIQDSWRLKAPMLATDTAVQGMKMHFLKIFSI